MGWLLLLCLAQEKAKVGLEVRFAKGDAPRVRASEILRATFDAETMEGATKVERVLRTQREFRDTILAVDDAGAATKVEREYETYTVEEQDDPKKRKAPVRSPLHGKRIVMLKKGAETVYEGADEIDAKELRHDRLRADPLLAALPKEKVAVGAAWKPDGKAYLDDLNATKSAATWTDAAIVATLERVEKGVATVTYSIKLRGKTDGGDAAVFDGSAHHTIDVAKGRVLTFSLSSSFVIQSEGRKACIGSIERETGWTWEEKR